jgi:amino acid transporter
LGQDVPISTSTSTQEDAILPTNDSLGTDESPQVLEKTLEFRDGYGILVGIIVGSGIFASPGVSLERSGSPGSMLLAWCSAGLLVMVASLNYLELTAMMPSAGADFTFLERAYGSYAAFSFAWFNFWISKTGSQAIIATVFGRYFEWTFSGSRDVVGDGGWLAKVAAVGAVAVRHFHFTSTHSFPTVYVLWLWLS